MACWHVCSLRVILPPCKRLGLSLPTGPDALGLGRFLGIGVRAMGLTPALASTFPQNGTGLRRLALERSPYPHESDNLCQYLTRARRGSHFCQYPRTRDSDRLYAGGAVWLVV